MPSRWFRSQVMRSASKQSGAFPFAPARWTGRPSSHTYFMTVSAVTPPRILPPPCPHARHRHHNGVDRTHARVVRDSALVVEAMRRVMQTIRFALRGIDTDNGGEFINESLHAFCMRERLEFTRSRPYRKNDQAHAQSRRTAPSCSRLLASENVGEQTKDRLHAVMLTLDPLRLLEEIRRVQYATSRASWQAVRRTSSRTATPTSSGSWRASRRYGARVRRGPPTSATLRQSVTGGRGRIPPLSCGPRYWCGWRESRARRRRSCFADCRFGIPARSKMGNCARYSAA